MDWYSLNKEFFEKRGLSLQAQIQDIVCGEGWREDIARSKTV